MKKSSIIILTVAIAAAALIAAGIFALPRIRAEKAAKKLPNEITEYDRDLVKFQMEARNIYADDVQIELLYNGKKEPMLLLATTSRDYIIIERATGAHHESGGGNPYQDYANETKYYGGPLNYYVERTIDGETVFFDIHFKKPVKSFKTPSLKK
ncbi:MAG: hypothetical protein IKS90_04980 [Clostridia bacterium]|nr:hypothetical protein [Clostridia bacterium]